MGVETASRNPIRARPLGLRWRSPSASRCGSTYRCGRLLETQRTLDTERVAALWDYGFKARP